MKQYIKIIRSNTYMEVGEIYEVPPAYFRLQYSENKFEMLDVYIGGSQTYHKIPISYVEIINKETNPEYFL